MKAQSPQNVQVKDREKTFRTETWAMNNVATEIKKGGRWAARAVETGDMDVLSGYEKDWRGRFGDTLERASKRRRMLEREWERLESIIKSCWVVYKEYYGTP